MKVKKTFVTLFKFKENIITVFYAFKLESLKDSYDISSFNCSIIFSNHLSNFWSLKCFNTVSAVGFLRGVCTEKILLEVVLVLIIQFSIVIHDL